MLTIYVHVCMSVCLKDESIYEILQSDGDDDDEDNELSVQEKETKMMLLSARERAIKAERESEALAMRRQFKNTFVIM